MRSLLLLVPVALVLAGCGTEGARRNGNSSTPKPTNTLASGRKPIIAPPLPASDALPAQPYIFISREVKRPGLYQWSSGITLTDAITSAGGFTEFAGRSKIEVVHKDHSVAGRYDYDRILKHKSADPVLEPGDIIHVIGSL